MLSHSLEAHGGGALEPRELEWMLRSVIPPGRESAILEPAQEGRMQRVQIRIRFQRVPLREDIL